MKPRHDIYATVTAQLVAAIESGAGEWRMPWHHSGAPVMRPTSVAGRRERVRFLRHRAVGTRARSRCAAHSALRPEGPAVPGARLGRDEKVILVLVRRRNQRPTALSETKRNAPDRKKRPSPAFR